MDMDLKELEDLAEEKHADLQEPSKKQVDSPLKAPGVLDASDAAPSQGLTTTASDMGTLHSQSNRDDLTQSQNASKVNQDLFYQNSDSKQNGSPIKEDGEVLEPKKKKKKKNKKKKGDSESELNGSVIMDNQTVEDVTETQSHTNMTNQNQYDGLEDEDFNPLREVLGESFYEDEDSSEDEGMPDYKIGGYHPIHVGEILLDRYVIIQKLGWGHFSTVWLTKDLRFNSYVALKIQKSAQHYVEAAYDEVDILDQVA